MKYFYLFMMLFCVACSSCNLENSSTDVQNLNSIGYVEDTTLRKQYKEIIKSIDPLGLNKKIVILKYDKKLKTYMVLHVIPLLMQRNMEDTYNYNGIQIITKVQFKDVNGVNVMLINFYLSESNGKEYRIDGNIIFENNYDILTIDKFGDIDDSLKDHSMILLFSQ